MPLRWTPIEVPGARAVLQLRADEILEDAGIEVTPGERVRVEATLGPSSADVVISVEPDPCEPAPR